MSRLILASGSPRRAELLARLGLTFTVDPPDVDERWQQDEAPQAYVERLARAKAAARAETGAVALGADTVVVHDGAILGKPAHPSEAETMLRRLSGQAHHVVTGVAVAVMPQGSVATESLVELAMVTFGAMTSGEIAGYVATGEPLDVAGGYALQGRGGAYVESINGHPTTVIGLPLPATVKLLARAGIPLR